MGLWLLGKRNHRRALKRRDWRYRKRAYPIDCTVARWARIAAPWHANEYPGAEILIMRLCGVSEVTARNWLTRSDERFKVPAHQARALADYIEALDGPEIARQLRAYAERRDAATKRPVVGRKRVA